MENPDMRRAKYVWPSSQRIWPSVTMSRPASTWSAMASRVTSSSTRRNSSRVISPRCNFSAAVRHRPGAGRSGIFG